ncbi:MAG: 50S ribosomal protein L6 [Bacteroidales bacterium]|nr:50S ribosomal protein L6 [Bacteroidales bacterium]
MSRIGKLPISIPQGVTINVDSNNKVTVKGNLGELEQQVDTFIKVEIEDGFLKLERESDENEQRAKHGLYRSLLANMITGVSQGFTIEQELVGVGYKVEAKGRMLELSLGYSHNIIFELPVEVSVQTITERGKNPRIILNSHDKQLIGQVAAKIRSFRKPEPYKGKGILFKGEVMRRKAGKAAAEK